MISWPRSIPYLRPLYDALYDMLGTDGARRLLDAGTIEVAPLAYMRGRTLNNSFIILDEAQNTTPEQMKMFLTRIGFGSKVVVTGDDTQIDLPGGRSGLVGLEQVLAGIEGLSWVRLGRRDVVRHRIVADIVNAYEVADGPSEAEPAPRQALVLTARLAARPATWPIRAARAMPAEQAVLVRDSPDPRPGERWARSSLGRMSSLCIRLTPCGGSNWRKRCWRPREFAARPRCRCCLSTKPPSPI